jgi:hypothetical protein
MGQELTATAISRYCSVECIDDDVLETCDTGYAGCPDVGSYYILLFNFAVVGLLAVFYQKGIPHVINQGTLIAASVLMAWKLGAIFPEWTLWTLLVALSLWDLCAVLSPCGPLKMLIKLVQSDENASIAGLLYEADVSSNEKQLELERERAAAKERKNEEPPGIHGAGASAGAGASINVEMVPVGEVSSPLHFTNPLASNPTAAGKIDLDAAEENRATTKMSVADAEVVEVMVKGELVGDTMRERLEDFYRRHNPDHIEKVRRTSSLFILSP